MPNRCNEYQLIEINRFDKTSKKWQNSNFKINKYETFHGCPLVIGVYHDFPAFWFPNGIHQQTYAGYHLKMIEGLARHLNFKTEFNPLIKIYGNFVRNLSTDFVMLRGSYNLIYYQRTTNLITFITQPYVFNDVVMAVPPGASYDGYQKLLLPFDYETWSLIIITFFASFITIFVLNFASRHIRNLVFGRNVTTPSLNVAAHFFGISQTTLPQGHSGRLLLTIFILYCLIIRTAWQGKMFKFMQKDIRQPEVGSIEELIERNFSFCMWPDFMRFFPHMEIVKR